MSEVTIICIVLPKRVFQLHGAAAEGTVRIPNEAVTATVHPLRCQWQLKRMTV
jgi:hypothetical protein